MTLHTIQSTPNSLRLVFRISLALLVMMLAERAANLSHGDPGSTNEPSNETTTASEADDSQPRYTSETKDGETKSDTQRLREGTLLTDVVGRFKISGDRTTFTINETGQNFGGLENLNMARVTTTIRDDPDADWIISGLVTEHRGLNFLLVQKAIRKTNGSNFDKKTSSPDLEPAKATPDSAEDSAPSGSREF